MSHPLKKLAVMFGGISPEHEVSVITGVQLINHVNRDKYEVLAIYIDKAGQWWTGPQLFSVNYFKDQDLYHPTGLTAFQLSLNAGRNNIDVAILCFHGQSGEGGHIQGVLEVAGIPYQGPGVTSSAVCFDKIMLRQILTAADIPQPKYLWFTHQQWQTQPQPLQSAIDQLGYPIYVKPANGGSTIGIERVTNVQDLPAAIAIVTQYDQRILVEKEVTDYLEVNVSVLGTADDSQASVPEQPIKQAQLLSFADKYQHGGGKKSGMASASRRIPAPISAAATIKVQELARRVFKILDCAGVIRIDFFVDPSTEEILVIEPNTIPGSMSYYLWEASGVTYPELIDRLVTIAERRHHDRHQLITSFESNILRIAR